MYANNKLDAITMQNDIWFKQQNFSQAVLNVIRCYSTQRRASNVNPFGILVIDSFDFDRAGVIDALDFLYENGVQTFMLADNSTASMRGLVNLINNSKYSISISEGYSWETPYNQSNYGVVIEYKKKRSR